MRASKDAAFGVAARAWFNMRFVQIGEMSELSIDTKKHAVHLELELRGEREPVGIVIKKYNVTERGGQMLLTIVDATASREWIAAVLREFVVGRSFPIPERI